MTRITWIIPFAISAVSADANLFGRLDATLRSVEIVGGGHKTSITQNGDTGSRFGIDDSETIGDLTVKTRIESPITLDGTTATLAGREASISVVSKLGTVKAGLTKLASELNMEDHDIYVYSGLGSAGTILASALGTSAPLVRTGSTINYILPSSLGGLYGLAQMSLGDMKSMGGRLGFAKGGVDLGVGFNRTDVTATDSYRIANLGVAWKFERATLDGLYIHDAVGSQNRDTIVLGAQYRFSDQWAVRTAFASANRHGKNVDRADSRQATFGAEYDFSKTSKVYANASMMLNDADARLTFPGAPTGAVPFQSKSRALEVGIRKDF